jgi:ABC-2 type transport system ATP-binding protein
MEQTQEGIDTGTLTVTTKSGAKIVDSVRIKVPTGKAYALLGKDSRAKRLVMRLAAANLKGVTLVDDESRICGLPLPSGKAYVWDADRLFSFMTCKEYLKYGSSGFKIGPQRLDKRIDALLETVSLTRSANKKICALSDAEYLCLCAAFALIIDSNDILINADTLKYGRESREVLERLINGLKEKGKTVLVNLSDPRFCGPCFDTVGIMRNGALVLEGEPSELAAGGPKAYSISGKGNINELRAKFGEISRKYGVRIRGLRRPTLVSIYREAVK